MPIKTSSIRTLYFYVIATVGLLMVVFSAADLINLALKTWVFPKAEEYTFECPRDFPAPAEGTTGQSPEEQRAECEIQKERAREERMRARQAGAVRDISFLVVGIPLFWFHFRTAQRERKEAKEVD